MAAISFTTSDAEILYSIPKPPSDIYSIVRSFVFINRASAPSYEDLQGCLDRSLKAGILLFIDGRIAVDDDWYQRIHLNDEISGNEIDSMIEFETWLTSREFPIVSNSGFPLSRSEYKAVQDAFS